MSDLLKLANEQLTARREQHSRIVNAMYELEKELLQGIYDICGGKPWVLERNFYINDKYGSKEILCTVIPNVTIKVCIIHHTHGKMDIHNVEQIANLFYLVSEQAYQKQQAEILAGENKII